MLNRTVFLSISLFVGFVDASQAVQRQLGGEPPTKEQTKEAVKVHRAQERDQILRDEALVGRRLTAAERAHLREQLRREWDARTVSSNGSELGMPTAQNTGWTWRSIMPWNWSNR